MVLLTCPPGLDASQRPRRAIPPLPALEQRGRAAARSGPTRRCGASPPMRPAAHTPARCSVSVICAACARPGRAPPHPPRRPRCLPASRGASGLIIAHLDYNSAAGAGQRQRRCARLAVHSGSAGVLRLPSVHVCGARRDRGAVQSPLARGGVGRTAPRPSGGAPRAARASNLLFRRMP